jgi:hypothetical protein
MKFWLQDIWYAAVTLDVTDAFRQNPTEFILRGVTGPV